MIANFEDPHQLKDLSDMLKAFEVSADLIPLFEDKEFLTQEMIKEISKI